MCLLLLKVGITNGFDRGKHIPTGVSGRKIGLLQYHDYQIVLRICQCQADGLLKGIVEITVKTPLGVMYEVIRRSISYSKKL